MGLAIADISTIWPQLSSIGKVGIDMNPESHREPRWPALKCSQPPDGPRLTSA